MTTTAKMTLTDEQKLEHFETKLANTVRDMIYKRTTSEQFNDRFKKYSALTNHYRSKLNKPPVFSEADTAEDDNDGNEILQIAEEQS